MRIGQVIRLQNDMNFYETHLKWLKKIFNFLYIWVFFIENIVHITRFLNIYKIFHVANFSFYICHFYIFQLQNETVDIGEY